QGLLGQEVLAYHIGIATMPNEPLAQPTLKAVETLRPLRRLERLHPAGRHVVLHRVMAAAQLPRNPLQTPSARPQAQHLRHVIRRLHHLPPWITPRPAFSDSFLLHSLSPQLSEEGAIPRDAEGAVFHGARQKGRPKLFPGTLDLDG